jgi:16S rRNA pseudouridine516 synthase
MSSVRLDRLMSNLGYGSRKEILQLARTKRVLLRGVPLTQADQAVVLADVTSGALTLDGERLDPPAPLTVMLHKPLDYICSHDEKGRLVYDLLPARWKNRKPALSCAGRLDKDSTGQVILTDDGDKLHRMTHPKSHAAKYYAVTLASPLHGDEAQRFASGTFVLPGDAKPLKPARWTPESETRGIMVLQEGRFHQIRRMFEALGNRVATLHRYQTGALDLGDLKPGEYRILDDSDIQRIFESGSPV